MKSIKAFLLIFCFLLVTESSSAELKEKVKIGMLIPLSGVLAEYGVATRNGIEIAVENNPEMFRNIEIIYEDTEWAPKKAISGFRHLVENEKVDLIYSWGNPVNEVIAPLAQRSRIPTLVMTSDESISRNRDYVIQAINSSELLSHPLGEHLAQSSYKNIAVVLAENTYVQGLLTGIKESLRSDQNIEVIARYGISDTDFRNTVTKLRQKSYDAIGVFLISGQVNKFYNQLAVQKIKLPSFGSDFFESETEIAMAGGNLEGAVYPNISVDRDFQAAYRQRHNNDMQISFAGHSHDIALYMARALNATSNPRDSGELLKQLTTPEPLAGVCGTSRYKNNAKHGWQITFPVYLKKIVENRILTIK